MQGKKADLTGQRFGRLVVIEEVPRLDKCEEISWRCKCDCGNEVIVKGRCLISHETRSCGCYRRDIHTTHGLRFTRIHNIWRYMHLSCYAPTNPTIYKKYGGRGIEICPEWKKDFTVFYAWAKEHGYKEGLALKRIDTDGNFCPENCVWVSFEDGEIRG